MDELIAYLEARHAEFSGPTYIGQMETSYIRGVRDGIRLALEHAREMR